MAAGDADAPIKTARGGSIFFETTPEPATAGGEGDGLIFLLMIIGRSEKPVGDIRRAAPVAWVGGGTVAISARPTGCIPETDMMVRRPAASQNPTVGN